MSYTIDSMDNCDVATTNIPEAFLQTEMEGVVWVRIDGILAEILLKIVTENYRDKFFIERGNKVIYMQS